MGPRLIQRRLVENTFNVTGCALPKEAWVTYACSVLYLNTIQLPSVSLQLEESIYSLNCNEPPFTHNMTSMHIGAASVPFAILTRRPIKTVPEVMRKPSALLAARPSKLTRSRPQPLLFAWAAMQVDWLEQRQAPQPKPQKTQR